MQFTRRVPVTEPPGPGTLELTLPFELRARSRLRARLSDGRLAEVLLPRGGALRGGERIASEDGTVVSIRAAPESVSTARHPDARTLLRAAYHLGNRHVALEILEQGLRYLHDPVLDRMVQEMGLEVRREEAPFEPEAGAYAGSHEHPSGESHQHPGHHHH